MNVFLLGLSVGFAYVAPIGLQNLFVINSSLSQSRFRAYMTALIIIFFDVTLGLFCFYGAGAIMQQSKILRLIILLIGSLVVIYIGYSIFKDKSELDTTVEVDMPWLKLIGTACVVTWFNPQAIIDGSLLLGSSRDYGFTFILGVMSASCIWFLSITTIITFFSNIITNKVLRGINIICGSVIIFYGLKLFVDFVLLAKDMFM
ncbi:L-lysine exporter family protein LysE/ArgO [Bacilli bacterium PM5-3]|nr:L-lysine exporter family protein LysE/ArgO [Bacilli bacterium PM5-3]MDH6603519.1 L-lysine exporter family protein LysE/ArgO [Bacilli bacterium PM5-9]